ncbi:MAG: hypothetical protein ACRDSP_27050, partial [Pseudonocardiaceae bacterium]
GQLVGLDREQISAIERGTRHLRDVRIAARVASRLLIPPGHLGFGTGATVAAGGPHGRKVVSWMDRRIFVSHVAALALGAKALGGLDVDRLTALLPQAEPTGTRHVGAGDVAAIEQSAEAFSRQDFAQGSAYFRDAAVAQLHSVLPLLKAQMAPDVRPRLFLATGYLAMMAGWISFEVRQHEAARRLWTIGVDVARHTDDPQGVDLSSYLLYDMALQAVELDRPDEALRLAQIGQATALGAHQVSGSTSSALAYIQARALAAQGAAAASDRALGQVSDRFEAIDQNNLSPWGRCFVGETHLASCQGSVHHSLALATGDQKTADRSVALLRSAVQGFGPEYARVRASDLVDLAGAHAIAGDTDTVVTVGHQALEAVEVVHSPRTRDKLRSLSTVLEPMNASPGVAELRERLVAA